MKKTLLLLVIAILGFGCSNDEKEIPNNLIGKWTTELETDYSSNGDIIQEYDLSKEECYHMTTYEFTNQNQFIKDSYDYDGKNCVQNTLRTETYKYSKNILTINNEESIEVIENSYSVLKLKTINDNNSYTIIEYSRVN